MSQKVVNAQSQLQLHLMIVFYIVGTLIKEKRTFMISPQEIAYSVFYVARVTTTTTKTTFALISSEAIY
jgi:hypothetical protein